MGLTWNTSPTRSVRKKHTGGLFITSLALRVYMSCGGCQSRIGALSTLQDWLIGECVSRGDSDNHGRTDMSNERGEGTGCSW